MTSLNTFPSSTIKNLRLFQESDMFYPSHGWHFQTPELEMFVSKLFVPDAGFFQNKRSVIESQMKCKV